MTDSLAQASEATTGGGSRRRIVLKFGSGVLTEVDSPVLDGAQVWRLMRAVAKIREAGHEVILVTSGAVAAGLKVMGFSSRPREIAQLQACAAVGQSKLMHFYEQVLREWNLHVGQMLVTHEDFGIATRREHMGNTLARLLQSGRVVPVFNENDSVAIEEIRFGDNDALSAHVAVLAQANLLILLTTVDGLLDQQGKLVEEVANLDNVLDLVRAERGDFSVGGMETKLEAVRLALAHGVQTIIANGRNPDQIPSLVDGAGLATRFLAAQS